MKKTHIFLSGMLMLAASTSVHGQLWFASLARTYTQSNVGIGTASYPTDSWLHIYGQQSSVLMCPDPRGGRPTPVPVYGKPELWIDRRQDYLLGYGCHPAEANLFQVSKTRPISHPTTQILDVINSKGWLGILQSNPTVPLDVNGNGKIGGNLQVTGGMTGVTIDMTNPGDRGWRNIYGNTPNHGISISAGGASTGGPGISMYGRTSTGFGVGREGCIYYSSVGSAASANYGHLFLNEDPVVSFKASMGIQKSGKVVIGENLLWNPGISNPTPNGYLLFVEKGILTEKVKVSVPNTGNWSDFVFNTDYKLMPLSEVEQYITANKHLPEIPSAEDVTENGIDVATMDAKLLQKIEELTLYTIQLQKQLEQQKNEIGELKEKARFRRK